MSDIRTRTHYDAGERTFTRVRTQDVSDILERNKQLQNTPQKSDWGRHVASIPLVVIEKWLNEEYNRGNTTIRMDSEEFNQLVERKLQDPNWKFLRVDK